MILPPQKSFGEVHFSNVQLGDQRRTNRLIACANMMARHPGGSLPEKFRSPKDLKGFYRLCDAAEVTHEAIINAHREVTLDRIADRRDPVLILHDSTELDYTTRKSLKKLGQIGNGNRRGYIAHNSLAIDPKNRDVIGVCNQILHRRIKVPKNETAAQRRKRKSRESRIWLQGSAVLPADWNIVDVCDQGADTFEFLHHEHHSGRRFVIRSAHNRAILTGHGAASDCDETYLRDFATQLPELGRWTLRVTSKQELKSPKKKGKKRTVTRIAREATMAVSAAPIQVKPPRDKSGDYANEPLPLWVLRVWEVSPPSGQERLEWFLLTNHPVDSFGDAKAPAR